MTKEEYREYLKAVDIVCLNCAENTLEDETICQNCPVRKTAELYKKGE